MTVATGRLALILIGSLAFAGCSSARFGGASPTAAAPRAPRVAAVEPAPAPVEALPSGNVTAEPLPPLPGTASPTPPVAGNPVLADVPTMPGSPRPVESMAPAAPPPVTSTETFGAGGSSRSASVGGWTAKDATGATCRVSLSSSPSLDLYKASAPGCANKDLAKVTAWDFRDGEVYLYQPGGAVAARLRASGGSLAGVIAKSGAPLTLTR